MGVYTLLPIVAGMGAIAGLAVIAVLIGRCFLKRGPKLFCYLLWSVVLFRLLCPVSIPSAVSVLRLFELGQTQREFSLVSKTLGKGCLYLPKSLRLPENTDATWDEEFLAFFDNFAVGGAYDLWLAWNGRFDRKYQTEEENTKEADGLDILPPPPALFMEVGVLDEGGENFEVENLENNVNQTPTWLMVMTWIWIVGMMGMLLYGLISLLRLRRQLVGAVRLRENIYQSDYIISPFVIGIFAPKIYLPSSLYGKEQEYILLHEQTHVKRGDHFFRLLAFAALVLHWFNPFVWVAFYFSGKDMEMACDEAVMRRMKEDIRAEYSASLLGLATGRHLIPGTYLAFGEGEVKGRIKNVMRYKKPTVFWIVFAVLFVSGTVCVFGSDPKVEAEVQTEQENNKLGAKDGTNAGDEELSAKDEINTGDDPSGIKNGINTGDDGLSVKDEINTGDDQSGAKDGTKENGENHASNESEKDKLPPPFLTVYSLENTELVKKMVEKVSSRYPEMEIRLETGEEGASVFDSIDALTAKITAGMGPDILILDGLPAKTYQSKGLLTDLSPVLGSLTEELQQNILSAYTQEEKVFMLPVHYTVPAIFADSEGGKAAKSLRSLMQYNSEMGNSKKIYLEKYSREDLLELTYYNYMPDFILPDGSVEETELANFLLFTKWLGDGEKISDGEFTNCFFKASGNIADFAGTHARVMFVPLCGIEDLKACADYAEKMAAREIELQSMDGIFFPEGLIGVNAWSQKVELANQFVQAVFSSEVQSEYAGVSGFSVNAKTFAQEFEYLENNSTYGSTSKKEWLVEKQEEIIAKISKNQMMDAAILQILQEESAGYFGGEILLNDCVAAIVERLP